MAASVRPLLRIVRSRLRELRARAGPAVDDLSVAAGRVLTRAGTTLLLYPHRDERIDIPHRALVEDLVEYTGLDDMQITALLQRRHESFRAEWHALPQELRKESWFYLSSRTYLFANAVHEADALADALARLLPGPSEILDFGGGAGNLALALAASGHRVDYVERSALQKDFVRFRIQKHGFEGRVHVLDEWNALAREAYELVCAFDVLEHIGSLAATLEGSLLPALKPKGILAECSPFVRTLSNPMHHENEADLIRVMRAHGFSAVREDELFRLWRRD
jgi:2-polyprenyl-3-methyl-5-hydroxy-6-metoxy-1,4-benzoquinol methylase